MHLVLCVIDSTGLKHKLLVLVFKLSAIVMYFASRVRIFQFKKQREHEVAKACQKANFDIRPVYIFQANEYKEWPTLRHLALERLV